jgi:hypothetical protein
MTANTPPPPSLAEALEALRKQKADGAPFANIIDGVKEIRGQIYSVKDPAERSRLFGECSELLKPF